MAEDKQGERKWLTPSERRITRTNTPPATRKGFLTSSSHVNKGLASNSASMALAAKNGYKLRKYTYLKMVCPGKGEVFGVLEENPLNGLHYLTTTVDASAALLSRPQFIMDGKGSDIRIELKHGYRCRFCGSHRIIFCIFCCTIYCGNKNVVVGNGAKCPVCYVFLGVETGLIYAGAGSTRRPGGGNQSLPPSSSPSLPR